MNTKTGYTVPAATESPHAGPIGVPPAMRRPFSEFCALLEGLAGGDLLGVTAFGPVLEPGFAESGLSATTVVVLQKVDMLFLRRLAEHGPHLGRLGIAAPLTMTPEYITSSLDTFPLEMLEIQQLRTTLCGADHFAGLEIEPEHLRLQCERELKRILIRLRHGLLAASGRSDFLVELEHDIGHHLLRTIRGLLWLAGHKSFQHVAAALEKCEERAGRSLPGIREAIRPDSQGSWEEFTALYHDAEALAAAANKSLEGSTH